jgi:Domain of unknown function DUF29
MRRAMLKPNVNAGDLSGRRFRAIPRLMNKHTPKQHLATYDSDFYLWSAGQAALIREGKFDQLDIENVAEEIESLGRSDRKSLTSQVQRLLAHLLKWQFQPTRRSKSWKLSIYSARDEIKVILDDSPSLNDALSAGLDKAYLSAKKRAALETGLSAASFPDECPYSLQQVLDEDFWPET